MDSAFSKWQPQRELAVPVYLQIESWIEELIFDQSLAPHTPLPTVQELTARFKVSALTVHKAYRRLKERGLVYAIVGAGTFVAPVERNRFVGVLIHREVIALSAATPTVLLYLDSLHKELAANGFVDRLIVDNSVRHVGRRIPISADAMAVVEDPSLEALIGITHEGSDELFDLLKRRRLPSIGFGVEQYDGYDSVVETRQDTYVSAALRHLREQGVGDIAVMYYDDPERVHAQRVAQLQRMEGRFATAGVTMRPDWVVGVSDIGNTGGLQAFEHLWKLPQRPRGLIIVDDVVARSAMTGIMVHHVAIPDDLHVCVLANTGSPITFPKSWARWEFNTTGVCRDIVSSIRALARGDAVSKITPVIPQPAQKGPSPSATRGGGDSGERAERRERVTFRTAGQILSMAKAR